MSDVSGEGRDTMARASRFAIAATFSAGSIPTLCMFLAKYHDLLSSGCFDVFSFKRHFTLTCFTSLGCI